MAYTWRQACGDFVKRYGGDGWYQAAKVISRELGDEGLAALVADRARKDLVPAGETIAKVVRGSCRGEHYRVTLYCYGATCVKQMGVTTVSGEPRYRQEGCKGTGLGRHPCKHQLAALSEVAADHPCWRLDLDPWRKAAEIEAAARLAIRHRDLRERAAADGSGERAAAQAAERDRADGAFVRAPGDDNPAFGEP